MPSVGGNASAVITSFTFTTKTAAYTAAAGDYVLANATSAAFTVTLPASPTTGTVVGVKKTDSSANLVTVVGSGSTTIDGDASCTLNAFDAAGTFAFDGSNWQIQSTVALNAASAASSSSALTVVTKVANYTANAGEYVLAQNTITITLPSSPAVGTVVGVRKIDYTNTAITVAAAQSIDGDVASRGYVLSINNQAAEFVYDIGGAWRTIRSNIPARTIPSPILVNNAWYDNRTQVGATNYGTTGTSSTYYMPYYLGRSMFFNGMAFYLGAAANTGGLARLGVYAMNPVTAQPSSILYDFGTINTVTTGFRIITNTSSYIPAGWVFLALAVNTVQIPSLLGADNMPAVLPNLVGTLGANGSIANGIFYIGGNDGTPSFAANPTGLLTYAQTTAPVLFFQTGSV